MLDAAMSKRSASRVWEQDRKASAAASGRRLRIRPYRAGDRRSIAAIIAATALRGRPLSAFFEDEAVLLKVFMDYYLRYEPESCFVAEREGRVVGYIMGCKDTRRYLRQMLLRYGPQLLARVLARVLTGRYRRIATYRTLWWALSRGWREAPDADLRQFPAHAHLGVAVELQRDGFLIYLCMVRLGDALIRHLCERGIRGLHGQIAEPYNQDFITGRTQTLYNCRVAAQRRFTLWSALTDERWYLKLLTLDLRGDRTHLRA
jgi:hypothetical protein